MGAVNESTCNSRSGQLAMDALGRLDVAEHAELAAHLATCEECRSTSAELTSTVGALHKWTKGATLATATVVPSDLTQAVFENLSTSDESSDGTSRFWRVAIACG